MKLIKFILPITALLLAFSAINAPAQICVLKPGTEYRLEDVVANKANLEEGQALAFMKWCCDQLGRCTQNYIVDDKYTLTHVAAREHKLAVLKYLAEERHIPVDTYPMDLVKGLSSDKTSYTQVMFAAQRKGGTDTIKYLVEQANADLKKVNDKQESALTLARGTADSDMIEYIKGAWIKLSATSEIRVKKNKEELVKSLAVNNIGDLKKQLTFFPKDLFNFFSLS